MEEIHSCDADSHIASRLLMDHESLFFCPQDSATGTYPNLFHPLRSNFPKASFNIILPFTPLRLGLPIDFFTSSE
jgi:hypothetical protein